MAVKTSLNKVFFLILSIIFMLSTPISAADDSISLASAFIRSKQYDKAEKILAKAPNSPQRTFMLGVTALNGGRPENSLPLFKESETGLPQLADYALYYQAQALMKMGKFALATETAASLEKRYAKSILLQRSKKLIADIYYEAKDYPAAILQYQAFIKAYPSGNAVPEALFAIADCMGKTGDFKTSAAWMRSLWLERPLSIFSDKAAERLRELEKQGVKSQVFAFGELTKRADTLYNAGSYGKSLQTLELIDLVRLSPLEQAQINIRRGKLFYKLRNRKQAGEYFAKVSAVNIQPEIYAQARYWLAQSLERQDKDTQALQIYSSIMADNFRCTVLDDSIIAAAGIYKSQGKYQQAITLYEKLIKELPRSTLASRARWESAWCSYLSADFKTSVTAFKTAMADEANREKALYWLARSLEQTGKVKDASPYYKRLLEDYEAGFYARWYRQKRNLPDMRQPLLSSQAGFGLPIRPGFETAKLLSNLGLGEEARAEMRNISKNAGESKAASLSIMKAYLDMGEYGAAIYMFNKNHIPRYDTQSMSLWSVGYPMVYESLVKEHSSINRLSPALVYALMRAESAFNPVIKSSAGAIGLMQLMPATAKLTAREKGAFNSQKLLEPKYNIMLGTKHLKELLSGYDGETIYAIAAYNAGANAVARWRKTYGGRPMDEFVENIPYKETRDYVKKVYASEATYRQLYGI